MSRRPRGSGGGRAGRGGGRGGGGVAPPAGPVLYGLQSFTVADFYQSVNSVGGIPGSAAGFWVSLLFRVDQLATGAARYIFTRFATPNGWMVFLNTTDSLVFTCGDGAASISAPTRALTAADVGKILLMSGVHTGSALLMYLSRAQVGTSTPITGYGVASARQYLGRRSAGSPVAGGTVFGMCGGNGVPTLAEIQAQADAVKLAGDIVGIPGKTSNLWSVKQDQAGVAPPVLDDKVGTEDMQIQGAPVLVQVTSPVWGW